MVAVWWNDSREVSFGRRDKINELSVDRTAPASQAKPLRDFSAYLNICRGITPTLVQHTCIQRRLAQTLLPLPNVRSPMSDTRALLSLSASAEPVVKTGALPQPRFQRCKCMDGKLSVQFIRKDKLQVNVMKDI